MNHLIFGGAGFIGKHLKQYLRNSISNEDQIFCYDNCRQTTDGCVNVDVRKPIIIEIPNSSNSIIYNLAAVHVTPGHHDNEYFETNVLGAENICIFARKNDIKTIVFISSIAPYGISENLKTEDSLPMPSTPYAISKLSAEYIHKLWQAEEPKLRKLVILRPGAVFGKGENGNFTRLYQSIKKGFFFYPGRKNIKKASVYIKDLVRIISETSQNKMAGVDTYNITYFPAPTIEEICNSMAIISNSKLPKRVIPGFLLKFLAKLIYNVGFVFNKKNHGIHPDRVKKLMVSTNVAGEKLYYSPFKLKYQLDEAIKDWFADCGEKGLF